MRSDPQPLQIPRSLLEAVYREARQSFPFECCGWLSGTTNGPATSLRPCANVQSSGSHPTAADRTAETAYVIGGDDLLALNHSFDSDTPALAIYHSHPNGRAYFSETDQRVATSPWGDGPAYPVQQLVVGIDQHQVVESALFAWSDEEGRFVEVARYQGAAI